MGDQPPTITQLDSSPELSKVFFSMFELIVLVLWSSTASLLSSAWLPGTAFVILCFILKFCALVSYVLLFISSLCLFSHPFSSSTVITPCVFRSFPSLFLSPSVLFVMHLLFLSVSLHPCAVPRVLSCTLICTLLKLLFFFVSYCVILPPAHWFLYSGHWTFFWITAVHIKDHFLLSYMPACVAFL